MTGGGTTTHVYVSSSLLETVGFQVCVLPHIRAECTFCTELSSWFAKTISWIGGSEMLSHMCRYGPCWPYGGAKVMSLREQNVSAQTKFEFHGVIDT